MATVYNVMLYGGLALAIVFAIVAVVLFFVLKIPIYEIAGIHERICRR